MQWRTHNRISNEALRRLGITLSDEVYESFREGIVQPDKERGRYDSHHHGRSAEIMDNLVKARRYFLQDDLPYAFFHLGVALHYVQDAYTSVISYDSPKNQLWHQNYEQNIEDSSFVFDVEGTIQYAFQDDHYQLSKYSAIARNLSGKVEGKDATLRVATLVGAHPRDRTGKPKVDLNLALKASLVVIESILCPIVCPVLETQLKENLAQHETFLGTAEIESSNKVIRLIEERERLVSKKVQSAGVVSKIKNWITSIRISLKNRDALSASRDYFYRAHLKKIANCYAEATNRLIAPYVGWYNFKVPPINIEVVRRDLLSVSEIAGHFGVHKNAIRETLNKGNVARYFVENKELIRRTELNRMLSQFPLNGFKEYLD
jgi:hypothetical protein